MQSFQKKSQKFYFYMRSEFEFRVMISHQRAKGQFWLVCVQFLQGKLAQKAHEQSLAEEPPTPAESELNRAELSSDASLINSALSSRDMC